LPCCAVTAGFTALYVAKQIVEADATGRAVVLAVCAEACTAHMSTDSRVELVIGNTIFADGAGAAIVTAASFVGHPPPAAGSSGSNSSAAAPPAPGTGTGGGVPLGGADWAWALGDMSSEVLPDSADDMTWKNSGDPGRFDMWLSKAIPRTLSTVFVSRGLSLLRRVGVTNPFTCAWAIHPGGAAIIKAFRTAFATMRLSGDGLEHSAEVLRANGNMSSATIFFVLQRVLSSTARSEVFTAGFGPGLTIEFGRLHRVPRGGSSGGGAGDGGAAAALAAAAASTAAYAEAAAVGGSAPTGDSPPATPVAGGI
jgi:predicted naringenin-chalcone synthase